MTGILDRVKELGGYLGEHLEKLGQAHKSVGEVRGIGLFWTIELVKDKRTKESFRKQTQKYAHNVFTEIADFLLKKNIYIPADKFGIWIVPPLIVKKDEIDFIVDSIDDALKIADAEVVE